MSSDRLAFFIGLLGSLHCIGMCGPLAFAVPVGRPGWIYLVLNKLIYQFGRIISYCVLGVLAGLLGQQLWASGLQQGLSILTGLLIILAALSRLWKRRVSAGPAGRLTRPFQKAFNYAFRHKANHLIIGIINGFLPCGFVYLALAGAINTPDVKTAVSYMFWFGVGTVPLMLGATVAAGFTGQALRHKITKTIPYMMLVLGVWFVLRGLELNIPYVSPPPAAETAVCK
ncbi:sulfite exporter TauE/SafE family protein [Pedobacter faecalis]|uniref:sulfite exporter TauE/SafE family protein n=1 Tax=Pedobacter faecalis TaxID=3041495 RepID=UPI00254D99C0|nr:sulfite exporter TauE/SafE family protein [Pedobacter sp. ELA7]